MEVVGCLTVDLYVLGSSCFLLFLSFERCLSALLALHGLHSMVNKKGAKRCVRGGYDKWKANEEDLKELSLV